MSPIERLFTALWQDYTARLCPSAGAILSLLAQTKPVMSDHIALRTFACDEIGLDKIAAPFLALGYELKGEYWFKEHKLYAKHFGHPDQTAPKVFISELRVEQCSVTLQQIVKKLVAQVDTSLLQTDWFLSSGRHWQLDTHTYQTLADESEYAAWFAAHGFGVNHFTVNVNELAGMPSMSELNQRLTAAGFHLDATGGEIKGSPALYLEQSATVADKVKVVFFDGVYEIAGGFYEFAKRYTLLDGNLYQGFVEAAAHKIFASTGS